MKETEVVVTSNGQVSIVIPIISKRCHGRRQLKAPVTQHRKKPATAMQLALARGFCWLSELHSGKIKSMRQLAKREGVSDTYVGRMIAMTTLAPDIVAAILDDTLPEGLTLYEVSVNIPPLWADQREKLGVAIK